MFEENRTEWPKCESVAWPRTAGIYVTLIHCFCLRKSERQRTGRRGGCGVLQGGEEQAGAQGGLCQSPLRGHVEHGVRLVQGGDQQLHQRAHLGFDTSTWG